MNKIGKKNTKTAFLWNLSSKEIKLKPTMAKINILSEISTGNPLLNHFGGREKCLVVWRTAVSSMTSLSCLVPLARLNPVPEEVGVITGVERTCAPDIRDMSPRGRSPPVTSAGAPRWRRVIRRSLSAREIGL